MAYPIKDHTGQTFGRLTVTGPSEATAHTRKWRCVCSCGTVVWVLGSNLRRGTTTSCGCAQAEATRDSNMTHGKSGSKGYKAWESMRARCADPTHPNYGGRGIKVCKAWDESFESFYADMGEPPVGLTLERVDVNGDYGPSNCIWDTPKAQANNTRANLRVTIDDVTLNLGQWAEKLGVKYQTLYARYKTGRWPTAF